MNICSVPNCNIKTTSKFNEYCEKHNQQIKKYGAISERTYRDKNEIIIEGEIAKITLYDKYCNVTGIAIIDVKYVEDIKNFKWCLSSHGYVWTNYYDSEGKQHKAKLHHVIISLSGQTIPTGSKVDHKNRNKLVNLEDNLRICSNSQNNYNRSKIKIKTSRYKGVSWFLRDSKWQATIMYNKQSIYLGLFDNEIDAARAYDKAAIANFGEFAAINGV